MSEEILKALMQLFALIIKQDGGVEEKEKEYVRNFLIQQLAGDNVSHYLNLFEHHTGPGEDSEGDRLTSVVDSVKILGICRKINKTLNQVQKVIVLVRLYELVTSDRKFTKQRMAIITTVAEVFKISRKEKESIENYVKINQPGNYKEANMLQVDDSEEENGFHIHSEHLDGQVIFLRVPGVGLYFMRYTGSDELTLNGLVINTSRIYLFANGSTLKFPKGHPLYYSDIAGHFMQEESREELTFSVENLEYRFPGGDTGLRNISFSESHGGLIGIMGASGSGKTTLLNNLCGIYTPSKGSVSINGLDLHMEKHKLQGLIGLIPQDDLLIEELSVYQNLYYNARLCFRNLTSEEIAGLVDKTLSSLGLTEIRDLRVGSPFNKLISGGQRKRLNIALELIREPSVLFVDEPTSGLSSRDSENVMDLLRELALKGKLVFVVIHQPSSEIYKMFDKIIIMDLGGYMIYYGNPVEAVIYFKQQDAQINSGIGECPTCGNVNPELLFNIIEARVVDEFGNYTNKRKVSPEKWEKLFKSVHPETRHDSTIGNVLTRLEIPGWIRQSGIFRIRDLKSKISNRQYITLTLLVSPLLAFILSYIIRYIADPTSKEYIFRENENIPVYIFMSMIVALFLGLIVSAEEIFRDRKILKRESFLNLSRSAYLTSKVMVLILISAIQALLFVSIGNPILGIKGMAFAYWLAFFSTAVCASILGLIISAAFDSAVTIYIVIPILMIPMMVLSGAMFSFDKLNRRVGSVGKVPWIAEIMIPKWSYEALMVHQFRYNKFNRSFYQIKKDESVADFQQVYVLPELEKREGKIREEILSKGKVEETADDLLLLKNEVEKYNFTSGPEIFEEADRLNPEDLDAALLDRLSTYLEYLDNYYSIEFRMANTKREALILYYTKNDPELYNRMKNMYHNESVEEYVRKVYEKNKMVEYHHRLVQQIDPVYHEPIPSGWLSFRSHFFAPEKYFAGKYIDTFWFNMGFIWFLALVFYILLYYNILNKLIHLPAKIRNTAKNQAYK